jgi:hypothetical protein
LQKEPIRDFEFEGRNQNVALEGIVTSEGNRMQALSVTLNSKMPP